LKKIWILPIVILLLTACGSTEARETVSDVYVAPAMASIQQIVVELPEELEIPVLQDGQSGELYVCDGYTVTIQTMESGDLQKTIYTASGVSKENVQILQTEQEGSDRYEFVWTANTEEGMQVGRCCILDDGDYHYVITAMAEETAAGEVRETWEKMFATFHLVTAEVDFNTGS
jgi:hypothetical protein